MKIMDILQGKWLGHPLHPALVHIPLGLWAGACALDVVVACGLQNTSLVQLSCYAVAVGLLGALIVIPTGVADWAGIKKEKPAWKFGLIHMLLNLLATGIWALNLGLRLSTLNDERPITRAILVLSLLATGLLFVSGYIGSLLAFDYGIGVARMSKTKLRQLAAQSGANLPKKK